MKLTNNSKKFLNNIIGDLERSKTYILKDTTLIGSINSLTHAKDNTWINSGTGQSAGSINKEIGSDLCYLYKAIEMLKIFIKTNE